jgi:hypothetical protein
MITQNITRIDGATALPAAAKRFVPITFFSQWVPASSDPGAMVSPELEYELEKMAFDQQYPEFKSRYSRQYVAIHNGKVEEVGPSEAEVTRRFFARFRDTHVYIGYVGDDEPATYQVSPLSAAD